MYMQHMYAVDDKTRYKPCSVGHLEIQHDPVPASSVKDHLQYLRVSEMRTPVIDRQFK